MRAEEADADGWDEVATKLSALITRKHVPDGRGWRESFHWMQTYLQRLDMHDQLERLRIVHVAGTKGKGSTCTMVESILRSCGYRTGLYTSPHLCDVRERIRINGQMVSKAEFARAFWWTHNRLKEQATEEIGMPGYFRFITLLGLKMFLDAQLDVVVLEVGMGGRLDSTNAVPPPVVCGITSIGFDHVQLLGNTLPEIAREKGGILKAGSPAFTVPQREDALEALQECAQKAGTTLEVPPPLETYHVPAGGSIQLGLQGDHQRINAALAVRLAAVWERRVAAAAGSRAAQERVLQVEAGHLPLEYCAGLAAARWPGRCQVVHDAEADEEEEAAAAAGVSADQQGAAVTVAHEVEAAARSGSGSSRGAQQEASSSGQVVGAAGGGRQHRLSFYLDGAHTVESLLPCADWFAGQAAAGVAGLAPGEEQQQVVVFNCTQDRDPSVLLPALLNQLRGSGLHVHRALFVPPDSSYTALPGSRQLAAAAGTKPVDLPWQQGMQRVWERELEQLRRGGAAQLGPATRLPLAPLLGCGAGGQPAAAAEAAVVPSLRQAVAWLRACVRQQPQLRLKVLVTGSLYLVGDMLQILGAPPR